MMRVLVLGANGFVGRYLIAALGASDWAEPVAGVRRAGALGVEEVVLDATAPDQVARALTQVDALVQCVAGDPRTIVESARALFAAPAQRRIVHLSSMAVYGERTGLVSEDAPLSGVDGYAAAKVEAERLAAARGDVTVLRPGCIYGGGSPQWSRRIAQLLRARRLGDLGEEGAGCSNVVHVDDVVGTIMAALRREDGGTVVNVAMPAAPDWNGYFATFAEALGVGPVRRIAPWRLTAETALAFPLTIAARFGVPAPVVITPSMRRLFRQRIELDTSRAEALLDRPWTPLAAGLAEAAASLSAPGRTG